MSDFTIPAPDDKLEAAPSLEELRTVVSPEKFALVCRHFEDSLRNLRRVANNPSPQSGNPGKWLMWARQYAAELDMADHMRVVPSADDLIYFAFSSDLRDLVFSDPIEGTREALRERLSSLLFDVLVGLDSMALAEIARERDDVLCRWLTRALSDRGGETIRPDAVPSDLARRARAERVRLEGAHVLLAAGEAAGILGVTRQALDRRRKKLDLLGVRRARNWLYPRDQFAADDVVAGLGEVLADLPYEDGWAQLQWMAKRREAFDDRNAFELLARGNVDPVRAEARKAGRHVAR